MSRARRRVMGRQEMLARIAPPKPQPRDVVLTRYLSAVAVLESRVGDVENALRQLVDVLNTLETLTLHMRKVDPQALLPVLRAASADLRSIIGGAAAVPRPALRDLVDAYAQCVELMPPRELSAAQFETAARVARVRAEASHSEEILQV